jgi:hemolysin activation/secretion protein
MPHLPASRQASPIAPIARRCGFSAWLLLFLAAIPAWGQEVVRFYVRQYKIEGGKRLSNLEAGEAVYPFLGPGRTPDDVENARAALEKVYHAKGFESVSVQIPEQDPRRGIIRLQVVEGKVARLKVSGARWHLPSRVRREVPSLAEGSVPDFKQVEKEIIAVNRLADRRVTPDLKPGTEPGTLDIELKVEDELPLHGSLELNNRHSADTSPLRVNGSLSYANLFQLGQTLGASVQIAPENTDDALVYSGFYLARVSDKASLMVNATRQDSDISTLGGAAVVGRGQIVGLRAMFDLPRSEKFHQGFDIGIDAKRFDEDLVFADGDDGDKAPDVVSSPIEYYPISANYSANWLREKHFTELNTALTFNLRGVGSDEADYSDKRYNSSGSFFFLRADAAHTRDIKGGAQVFGKVQGQVSTSPLINSEQYSGGGLGTARGYLESTLLGDNGVFITAELRSPTLIGKGDVSPTPKDEWRFHAFYDGGITGIYDPLPGQRKRSGLSSIGFGSRLRVREHYNASVDVAMPLIEQPHADDGDIRITFRGWADF